jgi:hypothetical protein
MKKTILSTLEPFPYFTLSAVKQLIGEESMAGGTVQTALYRWMKTGQVIKFKKGVYTTRHFFELHNSDLDFLPAISTILIPQSYNSLEFVLQRSGVLTETTFPISSITIKQPRVIHNSLGSFTYRHIKEPLYRGFTIQDYFGIPFARATLSKALFDFFYFRTLNGVELAANYNIAEVLRLNLEDFTEKDRLEFAGWVETSKSKKMSLIFMNLRKTIWRP